MRDTVKLSWIFTFAFLFATYIFTPQMNMILLPLFAFAPIARQYVEFLVFDLVNALVIVLGYSQALFVVGISYAFPGSLILYMVIVRSLWVGKFTIFDGVWRMLRECRKVACLSDALEFAAVERSSRNPLENENPVGRIEPVPIGTKW